MSENSTKNYKEIINDIHTRLENLVQLVDTHKNFYNNIFFQEKDKEVPMTLYNIHYSSTEQENYFEENEENLKQYKFDEPDKIFMLPSSEDSGNENSEESSPSFNQICKDIIDLSVLMTDMNEVKEKDLPKNFHPILMLKVQEPFNSMKQMLNFLEKHMSQPPYEILIFPITKPTHIYTFFIKFNSIKDAENIHSILESQYKIKSHICFDQRELLNSKWYCVIFRIEAGGEKRLNKFISLICDIYNSIPAKERSFISTFVESTCEAKIEGEECIRKLGDTLFCALKLNSLEQALFLCINYNKYYDLKVHLHNITYNSKKSKIPQILIKKDGKGENKYESQKIKKNYKEDDCFQNEVYDFLFPNKKLLSRKHKRVKIKNAS